MKFVFLCSALINLFSFTGCNTDNTVDQGPLKTENVIIVLIDGPRYSETWGDSTHQYIPGQVAISNQGIVCTQFYNNGITNTFNGHTAITTGHYETLDNAGYENPSNPSFFQLYLKYKNKKSTAAWIISSKDKLEALGNCKDPEYNNSYIPQSNCGVNGLYTGVRDDSVTFAEAINTFKVFKPRLAFVSFKEPDVSAHMNDWQGYLNGLKQSDDYAYKIWQFIQSDPHYKDRTALFITNDHGRHPDSVSTGFTSHGDTCSGCRHILLVAAGPDFKKKQVVNNPYELKDINATVSYILGIETTGTGKVISELFE